jgi:hypothetical protein
MAFDLPAGWYSSVFWKFSSVVLDLINLYTEMSAKAQNYKLVNCARFVVCNRLSELSGLIFMNET